MKEINGYSSPFNLGHRAVEGLFNGSEVTVQEKIDGSQLSFGTIRGNLYVRSHRAMVDLGNPGMFALAVAHLKTVTQGMRPGWVYRGEFLRVPKHNTLAYDRVPLGHIILFDIEMGAETCDYAPRHILDREARDLGIEVVWQYPSRTTAPTEIELGNLLRRTSQLGGVDIEGVVFKNYSLYGVDKKVLMAKYVSKEFREKHSREGDRFKLPKQGGILDAIAVPLATEARFRKAVQHLEEEGLLVNGPQDIGRLMRELHLDLATEEEDFIKEALYQGFHKDILKKATRPFPAWYKEQLDDVS